MREEEEEAPVSSGSLISIGTSLSHNASNALIKKVIRTSDLAIPLEYACNPVASPYNNDSPFSPIDRGEGGVIPL